MKILIIGEGGREHALAWKVAQSPLVKTVWVAPGNAGTALEEKVTNINLPVTATTELVNFAKEHDVDLTIIGPEIALAAGIVDAFQAKGLSCFGPTQDSARLETSKSFCKEFLQNNNIPTAKFACFSEIKPALAYINQQIFPLVIKANGLAAGKGVVIAENQIEAEKTIHEMLSGQAFGEAGQQIVIEEFLTGYELSYIVISDGKHFIPLASAQDHKRLLDHDMGPNTGGMGAFSPAPQLTPKLEQIIQDDIIQPTINAMADLGTPYIGFLYAGLMISDDLQPKVLEFNCRLGDPETQPILMRLQTDLVGLCLRGLLGTLNQAEVKWDNRYALTVVMTAGGYPLNYRKGDLISGLTPEPYSDCKVFHSGTQNVDSKIVTHGGRVLGVTALGETLEIAQEKAYIRTREISWEDVFYRNDIGGQTIQYIKKQSKSFT